MRPRSAVALLTIPVLSLLLVSLAGCSGDGAADSTAPGKPAESASKSVAADEQEGQSGQATAAKARTPEEFLARAEQAMSGEKGWTFAVKGSEELVLQGQQNAATYTATVHRTEKPEALHSTGTTYAKGVAKPEETYVVGGKGYVKAGGAGAQWRSGPLSDPEIANKVEDPVTALDAFKGYAGDKESGGGRISLVKSGSRVELQVRTSAAALPAVSDQGVVKKAVRELTPTLKQLRSAGVTVPDSQITVQSVQESLVLDPTTYRIVSHHFQCAFLIPYGQKNIHYSQDVSERNEGLFTGAIALPVSAR